MSPRRILLAWEHGRNLGHLVRLSEIAAQIKARGAEVVWALPAPQLNHPLVKRVGGVRYVMPLAREGGALDAQPNQARLHSFADVLLSLGFADVSLLEHKVSRWLNLFEAVRPHTLLCDYAPAAQIAACLAELPAMQITNGFDAPPMEFPLFESSIRGPYIERARAKSIEQLSEAIQRIGHIHKMSGLDLRRFMSWPRRMLDIISEVNPYGPIDADGTYVGPFIGSENVHLPQWPASKGENAKRVFAYLRGDERLVDVLLKALSSAGASVCCVWPEASDGLLQNYKGTNVHLTRQPVDLSASLHGADAVVNYGSSSMLCSALLAGKPQLMVPMDVEKLMFARRVESQGAGVIWQTNGQRLQGLVDRLMNDALLERSARAIAERNPAAAMENARTTMIDALVMARESATARFGSQAH